MRGDGGIERERSLFGLWRTCAVKVLALALCCAFASAVSAEGSSYRKLDAGRILLMNNDANAICSVRYQGYYDTDETAPTYWTHDDTDVSYAQSRVLLNLNKGIHHVLWQNVFDDGGNVVETRRLWELVQCRFGSAAMKVDFVDSNYLPWSPTAEPMDTTIYSAPIEDTYQAGADELKKGGMRQAATIVMRSTTDACVYSPCYAEGVGDIWFDAVNMLVNRIESAITVEFSTNITAAAVSMNKTFETADNNDAELDWHVAKIDAYYVENCSTLTLREQNIEELTLASTAKNSNGFYRVHVALASQLNGYNGPVRIRIRRSKVGDAAALDFSDLILIDNILVAYPQMVIKLDNFGYYDTSLKGGQIVGQGGAFSIPFPKVGEEGNLPRVKFYGENSAPTTFVAIDGSVVEISLGGSISDVRCHYRWRYLNQTSVASGWTSVDLPEVVVTGDAEGYATATEPIAPMTSFGDSEVGDVEYYFTAKFVATKYVPVDYALGSVGYGVDESTATDIVMKWDGEPIAATGDGENFFFRLREGASEYEHVDAIVHYGDDWGSSSYTKTIPLELVGDGVWRGVWDLVGDGELDSGGTVESHPIDGKVMYFRFVGYNRQTPGGDWSVNTTVWVATASKDTLEASGLVEESGAASPDRANSYIEKMDSQSGALVFKFEENTRNYSITHGEYQNFNNWANANRVDETFTGTEVYTSGVSRAQLLVSAKTSEWSPLAESSRSWQESFIFDNPQYGVEQEEFETPNGWMVNNGIYVGETGVTNGLALQLAGLGEGKIACDKTTSPGIGEMSFKARLGQFLDFGDFSWYGRGWDDENYYFAGKAAISILEDGRDASPGMPSISVIGYYRPNNGCYEFRVTRLPRGSSPTDVLKHYLKCTLYKWTYDKSKNSYTATVMDSFCIGTQGNLPAESDGTTRVVDPSFMHSLCGGEAKMAMMYIGLYNTPSNTVQIVGGISKNMDTSHFDADAMNCAVLNCEDKDDPLLGGSYGMVATDCLAYFMSPATFKVEDPNMGGLPWWPATTNVPQNVAFLDSDGSRADATRSAIVSGKWAMSGRMDGFSYGTSYKIDEETSSKLSTYGIDANAFSQTWQYGFYSLPPKETIFLQTRDVGESAESWTTRAEIPLDNFADTNITVSVRRSQNAYLRLVTAKIEGSKVRTDVVVDDLYFTRWRGENTTGFSAAEYGLNKDWVYTAGWVTTNVVSRTDIRNTVRLDPARGTNGVSGVMSVRSPLLTNGVSLVKFNFKRGVGDFSSIPATLPCYFIQVAEDGYEDAYVDSDVFYALSGSYDDPRWRTVDTLLASDAESFSSYSKAFYVRGPKRVAVRLVASEYLLNAASGKPANFGSLEITDAHIWDDPPLDAYSWWGWNMRTMGFPSGSAPDEMREYLADAYTSGSGRGLSGALNYSADPLEANIDPDSYISLSNPVDAGAWQHSPFIQTPYVTNGIGQLYFRGRVYDNPTSSSYSPTYVSIYGVRDSSSADGAANTSDPDWEHITDIEIDSATYKMYEWTTIKGDTDPYKIIRLVVRGARFGRTGQYVLPDGRGTEYPADEETWDLDDYKNLIDKRIQTPIERVLIDEVTVAALLSPRLGFKNVRPFRDDLSGSESVANIMATDEQPLLGESFGFQAEITQEQMFEQIDPDSIKVHLMYYVGRTPWGWQNWTNNAACVKCELPRASDWTVDHMVFRSGTSEMASIVPAQSADAGYGYQTVQYMMYVTYKTLDGEDMQPQYLTSAYWTKPEWYDPIDLNKSNDFSSGRFSPYTLLDSVSPKRVWFNEVNYSNGETRTVGDSNLVDENALTNQYIEIAVPQNADLKRWTVRLTEGQGDELNVTNLFQIGYNSIPSSKVRNDPMEEGDHTNSYAFLTIKSPKSSCKGDASWPTWWRATGLSDKTNGKLDPKYPYAFELIRPNGIVEHRIIVGGATNWVGSATREAKHSPTNLYDHLVARDGVDLGWVLLGYDPDEASWSVITNHGAIASDWSRVKATPTLVNAIDIDGLLKERQYIDPAYYLKPNGSSCWVMAYIDSLFLRQDVGNGSNAVIFSLPRWDGVSDDPRYSTNITYTASYFHRISSLTTNGVDAIEGGGERTFTLNFGKLTDDLEIHASADIDPNLALEYGLDEDSRYRPAVMDWLEDLTAERYAEGQEEPEIHRSFLGKRVRDANGQIVWKNDLSASPLTLIETYWLDLDPFTTNLVFFQVGAPVPVPLYEEDEMPDLSEDPALTNVIVRFNTMVTNVELGGVSWPLYTLRGLEYGSSSADQTSYAGSWDGPVFKVRACMPDQVEASNPLRWAALRYFTLAPDSFADAGDGTYYADIEVADPFSRQSPGSYFYPYGWKPAYRGETVWYSLAIEDPTEGMSLTIMPLKPDSTLQ